MGIAAVERNGIINEEFKEIHYTVTTPNTPQNMGGFGVHITLVRHSDTKTNKSRVHVYFAVLDGALLKLNQPGEPNYPITNTSIFRDFMAAALVFFNATCAQKNWAPPVTATITVPLNIGSNTQFPGLPQRPPPVLPSVQPLTQTVALPSSGSNQAPMQVIFPASLGLPSVVESVLLASGAFDDDC